MKLNNMASRREFLKTMPTPELDEMLQAELHKENIDDDLARLILDVLEEREADYPVETDEDVAAAVEKFEKSIDIQPSAPAKTRWPVLLKVASVLLVVGLLVFVVPQAAHAESFFEMLARWTDSIFEFFSPGVENEQPDYVFETDHPGLQQIYDAVVEMGVTDPVVPMWIPDGYELIRIKIDEWPAETTVYADLRNQESCMYITITARNNETSFQSSKDTQNVKKYEVAGISHYIIANKNKTVVTWITNDIECLVAIDCQEEEAYKLLESIYAMEDS